MNRPFHLLLFLCCHFGAFSQPNLAEQLGYPPGSRLLIIHADDLGMAHSQNVASFLAMAEGSVRSASIMPPCPWMAEVADWAKENPGHDLGIHLTLTNEWKHFRWGPVTPANEAPGLVNELGFLHADCGTVAAKASPGEVEKELRAQIEQTLRFGIQPTHLDSHMGCLFWGRPEYFEAYLKLGREYGIPVMLSKEIGGSPLNKYLTSDDLLLDHIYTAIPENYAGGMANYYENLLRELPAGVSALLIHCAFDNLEFQGVSVDHPDWGSAWRQADFDFFTSEKCRQILAEENIRLVTWRELGERWRAKRLKEKIGQMLLYGFRGMSVDENSSIVQHIAAGRVGNVILFDYDVPNKEYRRNIESPEQVKALVGALQAHAAVPLLVAIDQEGGKVLRLKPKYGFPYIPSALHLGTLDNLDSTRYYAELNSRNMAGLGINLNFSPVVDLNIQTESGVIGYKERSFSDDPEAVARHAQVVAGAHLSNGVIPVMKHFPGHGSARGDSHKGLTDVTGAWSAVELEPYRRIIGQGYQGAVMTAHVFNQKIDGKYPATLSAKAISILRDSIGYEGVVFSDDMQMEAIASEYGLEEAIVLCINAGVDVLCFGNNLGYDEQIPEKFQAIVLKAVEEGKIRQERIEEAYERIMRLKGQLRTGN